MSVSTRARRSFVICANEVSATSRTPEDVANGPTRGAAISMRYTGRDSSSLAPANIWTGPAISSSWPFGNASSRMRCGAGIGRLYQSAVETRRPKASHFGPRQGPVGNWQGCRSGRDALLVLELYGHVLQHRLPQLLLAANKRLRFGRGGGMHLGAACRTLGLDLRVRWRRAQIVADLAHDRVGRSDRRHHALPADGDKTRQRFCDGRQIRKVRQTLLPGDRQGFELA